VTRPFATVLQHFVTTSGGQDARGVSDLGVGVTPG